MIARARTASALSWLLRFAWTQALCLIFPLGIFAALALSHALPDGIARYDFMLLACLALQAFMVASKLETPRELLVICVFHALGLGMELFKVAHGSWAYPEFALSKVGGVPLYSGFMYASVASYLCQVWRRFDLRLSGESPAWQHWTLGALIYVNFFSHHFLPDLRWVLTAGVFWLYRRAHVALDLVGRPVRLPMPLAFVLLGALVYLGENVATLFGAWQYPNQAAGWRLVGVSKLVSWFLLVIVSFIVVATVQRARGRGASVPSSPPAGAPADIKSP